MDLESLKATKNNFLDGLKNLTTCGKILNGGFEIMLHLWTYIYSKGQIFTLTEN